jgi:hypothetical protein
MSYELDYNSNLSTRPNCMHPTAGDRFQEWVKTGVEQFDKLQKIDWNWLSIDEAITKASLGVETCKFTRLCSVLEDAFIQIWLLPNKML